MKYEVEQKFPVESFAQLESRLREVEATPDDPLEQVDTYFAHPTRDFGKTDEALRIRRIDQENQLTYKGPKIDATTKTRREIEMSLPPGEESAVQFTSLLKALGFRPVAEVRKTRHPYSLSWNGHDVEAALDEVDGLGFYAELELLAGPDELDSAKTALKSLAIQLGLEEPERRSYLELLREIDEG